MATRHVATTSLSRVRADGTTRRFTSYETYFVRVGRKTSRRSSSEVADVDVPPTKVGASRSTCKRDRRIHASSGSVNGAVTREVEDKGRSTLVNRRQSFQWLVLPGAGLALNDLSIPSQAWAYDDEEDDSPVICDKTCVSSLDNLPLQTTPSGLQFRDIKVGNGPSPPVGFQVAVNYVAMFPDGKVFENSLLRREPYDVRVGTGVVVAGLDEGILTMRAGGIRRLYVPGPLSFPKGLPAAPGRPRLQPYSPCIFDVELLYVPGFDLEDYVEEQSAADIAAAVGSAVDEQ